MAVKDHLVVLVHGLWGAPVHLAYLTEQIKKHDDRLLVYVPKNNSGYFTYDGIDTCAERVVKEVETFLAESQNEGDVDIKKISVIGYSLGGLIARYLIGLLYANGTFDRFTPVNFTTFATPHLGVYSPDKTFFTKYVWNFLGPRSVSRSGQQMFLSDSFRDTGMPLLLLMTRKSSIFYKALSSFQNLSLYANCVNDRTVSFFTAAITSTDPFQPTTPAHHHLNYIPSYEPNVVDYSNPFRSVDPEDVVLPPMKHRIRRKAKSLAKFTPLFIVGGLALPLALVAFMANALIQNNNSAKRIQQHILEEAESEVRKLSIFLSEDMQDVVESVLDMDNQLSDSDTSDGGKTLTNSPLDADVAAPSEGEGDAFLKKTSGEELAEKKLGTKFELGETQAEMERNLNSLKWRKYPVYIHGEKHSHAAIIVRRGEDYKWGKNEGKVVVRHWLMEEFVV